VITAQNRILSRYYVINKNILILQFGLSVFLAVFFLLWPLSAQAGINETINLQGKLTDNDGTNFSGACGTSCDFQVKIFDSSSGGTELYSEIHTNVSVVDGIFNIKLGSVTSLDGDADLTGFDRDDLYIQIELDADDNGSFEEVFNSTSRVRLSSVPYALNSKYLGGISSGGYVQIAPSSVQTTGNVTNSLIWLNEDGTGTPNLMELEVAGSDVFVLDNLGNAVLSGSLQFSDSIFNPKSSATATVGRVYFDSDDNNLYVWDGTSWVDLTVQNSLTGSGSAGQVTFWTSASNVSGDNGLFWDNTNKRLGIGTTTPGYPLEVVGTNSSAITRTVAGAISSPQAALQLGLDGGTMQSGGGPSLLFYSDDSAGNKEFTGRITSIWENPTDGAETAGLVFNVRGNTGDTLAYTEAMRILSSKDIGIGTSTIDARLDVYYDSTGKALEVTNTSTAIGLNIDYTGTGTASQALIIGNSSTGAITTAIDVSDTEIVNAVNLGTNNIVSSDGGSVSWNDTAGNELVQFSDLSTNFGMSVESGAMVDRNSYIGEEFNKFRNTLAADTAGVNGAGMGDGGGWGVYESSNCTFSTPVDTINGIVDVRSNATNNGCLVMMDDATRNARLIINSQNLSVILMKVKPDNVGANNLLYVGASDQTDGSTTEPPNFIGFTNNGGNTWTGRTSNIIGTVKNVTCTGQTISTTQYALLKAEVRSTTDVRFYVDNDVSDGINWYYCGQSTTNITTNSLAPQLMYKITTGGTAPNSLDVDFYRLWQDDSVTLENNEISNNDNINIVEENRNSFEENENILNKENINKFVTGLESYYGQFDEENALESSYLFSEVDLDNMISEIDYLAGEEEVYLEDSLVIDKLSLYLLLNQKQQSLKIDDLGSQIKESQEKISELDLKIDELYFSSEESMLIQLEIINDRLVNLENADEEIDDILGETDINTGLEINNEGFVEINKIKILNSAEFQDISIFGNMLIYSELVKFNGLAVEGHLTLSNDSAGKSKIEIGQDFVKIEFENEYKDIPIIVATPSLNKFIKYYISDVSTKGFSIYIEEIENEEIEFNWIAVEGENQ